MSHFTWPDVAFAAVSGIVTIAVIYIIIKRL